MKYFDTLPTIITTDFNGNAIVATNLLARASLISGLLQNPSLFYEYDIQENDTPEIIAHKYYSDPYRFWLILFANEILDPQWEWPMTTRAFNVYINDKYAEAAENANTTPLAYTQTTLQEYRKVITTTDTQTNTITIDNYTIDSNTYDTLVPSSQTITFSDGTTATQSIEKESIDIYTWENEQNEKKRSIKIINSIYVNQLEKQFETLMAK